MINEPNVFILSSYLELEQFSVKYQNYGQYLRSNQSETIDRKVIIIDVLEKLLKQQR